MPLTESQEHSSRTFSRRDWLAGIGAIAVASQIPDDKERKTPEMRPFAPNQLGITIDIAGIQWLHLDVKKTVESLLRVPGDHIRIAFPLDQIYKAEGKPADFSKFASVLDQAKRAGKTIHAQMGVKTFGWPEVHLPLWFLQKFATNPIPPGGQIDKDPRVAEFVLKHVTEVAGLVLPYLDEHDTYQIENEPFSIVSVANKRFISYDFNHLELEEVKKIDRLKDKRQTIQNLPINLQSAREYPKARDFVFAHNQIVGLNMYPQHNETGVPNGIATGVNWITAMLVAADARAHGMDVFVTEQQAAQWRGSKVQFDIKKGIEDFQKTRDRLKPSVTVIWDPQQAYAEAQKGNTAHFDALMGLGIAA